MPYISPSMLLLQLSGAVMMAAILHHFYRVYGLHYLLLCRRSQELPRAIRQVLLGRPYVSELVKV